MRTDTRNLQSFMDVVAQSQASAVRRSERWIPSVVRPPSRPMPVLALFDGRYRPGAEVIWYQGDGNWCGVDGPDDSPSHWQELPQPLSSNENNMQEQI